MVQQLAWLDDKKCVASLVEGGLIVLEWEVEFKEKSERLP